MLFFISTSTSISYIDSISSTSLFLIRRFSVVKYRNLSSTNPLFLIKPDKNAIFSDASSLNVIISFFIFVVYDILYSHQIGENQ